MLTNQTGDGDLSYFVMASEGRLLILALHQMSLWGAAYFGGHLVRRRIRALECDHRWPSLRSASEWYYLLTGEVAKFRDSQVGGPETPDYLTWVDVLTACGNRLVLYSGVLIDFHLNERGGLETLYLLEPYARDFEKIKKDTVPLAESRQIAPSSVFVINGGAILNLNVAYQDIPPDSESAEILTLSEATPSAGAILTAPEKGKVDDARSPGSPE